MTHRCARCGERLNWDEMHLCWECRLTRPYGLAQRLAAAGYQAPRPVELAPAERARAWQEGAAWMRRRLLRERPGPDGGSND